MHTWYFPFGLSLLLLKLINWHWFQWKKDQLMFAIPSTAYYCLHKQIMEDMWSFYFQCSDLFCLKCISIKLVSYISTHLWLAINTHSCSQGHFSPLLPYKYPLLKIHISSFCVEKEHGAQKRQWSLCGNRLHLFRVEKSCQRWGCPHHHEVKRKHLLFLTAQKVGTQSETTQWKHLSFGLPSTTGRIQLPVQKVPKLFLIRNGEGYWDQGVPWLSCSSSKNPLLVCNPH